MGVRNFGWKKSNFHIIISFIHDPHDWCLTNKHHDCLHPPPEGFIIVNVDGSSFGNIGNTSFGGLLRNDRGNWTHWFSRYCGKASNLWVELSANWRGLQLA